MVDERRFIMFELGTVPHSMPPRENGRTNRCAALRGAHVHVLRVRHEIRTTSSHERKHAEG